MRFIIFICLFPVTVMVLKAQTSPTMSDSSRLSAVDSSFVLTDSLATDSVYSVPVMGIFGEIGLESIPMPSGNDWSSKVSIGLTYKSFYGGAFLSRHRGEYIQTIVFPNEFSLLKGYGGGFAGYHIYRNRFFHTSLRLTYGLGDMVWEQNETKVDFLRDTYQVLRGDIYVNLALIEEVKLFLNIGYTQMTGLELENLQNSDFSGIVFGGGLRLGVFK